MATWGLLDVEAEQSIHKARLLAVEERPFKRLLRNLSAISDLSTKAALAHQPAADAATSTATETQPQAARYDQLREDVTVDFAAFDSSLMRLQFMHDANARERERYAADQERILAECQDVRLSNAQLREQLAAAQATLAQRKKFDELADKILSSRMLKPRDEQVANLAKLEEECRELERERETYAATWGERRGQFNRIMEEGMLLRRQIRDEKEEVDRREGMDEGDISEAVGTPAHGGQTPAPGAQTPKPEPEGDGDGDTPQIEVAEPTPNETETASGTNTGTPAAGTPGQDGLRPPSRSRSKSPLHEASPAPQADSEHKDVDMGGADTADTTRVAAGDSEGKEAKEDKMEVDS